MLDFALFGTALRKEEIGMRSPSQPGKEMRLGKTFECGSNRFQTLQKSKTASKVQGKINIFKGFQCI